MVIKELLEFGIEELSKTQYTVPLNESRRTLSFLLDKDINYIMLNDSKDVSSDISTKYKEIIKRRTDGEPLQYIINEANFYGYDFYVDERSLIPRFDTENLAYQVINIGRNIINPAILEIGAGSGAISSTIAMELPNSKVIGVDISEDALEVCKINREKYNIANLEFIKSNLFENVTGKYDVILSNPPYIRSSDMDSLQKEVKMEPILALDGGMDGLDFYREIIKNALTYLKDKGYLIFEIGYDQSLDVKKLLLNAGFNKIEIIKDLQGLDRVVKATVED